MDSTEFRKRGMEMVEYICNYLETLGERRVTPSVEPGYLRHLLPCKWQQLFFPYTYIAIYIFSMPKIKFAYIFFNCCFALFLELNFGENN